MQKIQTRQKIEYDKVEGIQIADPYRWLENAEDPEVKDWITQQNALTNTELRNGNFEAISNELVKNYKSVEFSNPLPVKGFFG